MTPEKTVAWVPRAGQVAVVCGAGFLGGALAQALRDRGVGVVTVDPVASAAYRCTAAELPEVLPGAFSAPDIVFCCAATHGGSVEDYRACYFETALAMARRFRCPLVACSSISVYDVGDGRDAREDSPLRTDSGRVDALLQAEDIACRCGGVVARLSPLYGEGRCELLRRHVEGEPRLPGPPERLLNYLHRDDAVSALLCLARYGACGSVYNVCGETLPHAEAYRCLESCTGVPAASTCSPAGRRGVRNLRVDTSRLRALGWEPACKLADFFNRNAPAHTAMP